MKLLLTSFMPSAEMDAEIAKMVGKALPDIKLGYIENAYDVYDDEASLIEGRNILKAKGYDVELVDLRQWRGNRDGLRAKLASKDMFLLTGGNGFYLRALMKATGADEIIVDLVTNHGKVYSAASAGAVVAGPTLHYFEELDDPNDAEELVLDGLKLMDTVIVPHVDNAEFGEGCRKAGEELKKAGYKTQWLTDAQGFLINGNKQRLL